MPYIDDPDLEFLGKLSSAELEDIFRCIVYDKDNTKRWTESLTSSEEFKMFNPDHCQYWREIAGEIQRFGANTICTVLRGGKGVVYREVLTDVCDKLKVNYNKNASTERIEFCMFEKVLCDAMEKMTDEDLAEAAKSFGFRDYAHAPKEVLIALIQGIIRAGGFKSYQVILVIANALMRAIAGRGLSFALNAALSRAVSLFAGPVGWIITAIWALVDIAGPAYRVTIPLVIEVATLRQYVKMKNEGVDLL
ncbi:protein of unknown function UPF0174 [Aminomonas paucivorans DSM 12260]|uniref:Uncharacterized protein n=1 Tax=Aminomonas paucivorans DSM 12260 TaxID=584708 RepID=E3D0J1_9BACT|nr:DUF3944 domain-containing protein [Aminomonas paucivorans]EFQ23010.1 protein of unknown function UPF0174 [Aminomonas paucivorans DSM 12260]